MSRIQFSNKYKLNCSSINVLIIPVLLMGLMFIFFYGMGDVSAVNPVYVSTHGNDNWNGLSPTHIHGTSYGPKATIKNGIKTVKSGGALHIASGIYKENTITINKNIYIIGTSKSRTTIYGNNKGPIFQVTNKVVTVSIHNLTLINTKTNGDAIENQGSGNLYINKCSFNNNAGGAIENDGDGGAVIVKDTIFSKNTVAIYNYVGYTMHLTNCTFNNNKGKNREDYLIFNEGIIYMDRCNFINNPTVTISNSFGGSIIATRSIFTNNTCAIENNGGLFINCSVFTKNTKGAIRNYRMATVNSSKFIGNNAVNGGAICNQGEVSLTVTNSTFTNNKATFGGAIYSIYDSVLDVTNSTFNNNTATENGGAIYYDEDVIMNVTSCIFKNNTPNNMGSAGYSYSGATTFHKLI